MLSIGTGWPVEKLDAVGGVGGARRGPLFSGMTCHVSLRPKARQGSVVLCMMVLMSRMS